MVEVSIRSRPWRPGRRHDPVEILVLLALVGLLAGTIGYSTRGLGKQSQTPACEADTRSLRNAEEANFAQIGDYDTQAALVTRGLLSRVSVWHGVTVVPAAAGAPTSTYIITVLGTRCGHNGNQVGQTALDR